MSGRRRPHHAPHVQLLALLLVAGCGGLPPVTSPTPASPPPSPTPSETAPPTPAVTPRPTAPPRHGLDEDVGLAGLKHDSRDLLYRTPGRAVPAGTPVTLRLRTFRDDVSAVRLRLFSLNASAEALVEMTREADAVSCYDEQLDAAGDLCDYWSATLDNGAPDNVWYRFIVSDGARTVYYADDTAALDGGVGRATPAQMDNSYALLIHEPGFEAPDWATHAVAYQIFPDRFRNGDPGNDPQTGDVRYDDPVLALDWSTLPEGYCRSYTGASADTCPWRFDETPPSWSPDVEGPRGRDYMGGDLAGVREQLPYLADLGVTAIYFNPIFASGSNHGYDTRDYEQINPYFGTNEEFAILATEAEALGIRLILDGVFNHTSSDAPWFDRYGHYAAVGACEAVDSEWREWYYMTTSRGPCVGPDGEGGSNYQSWFGFDTLPILLKNQPDLRDYFIDAPDSVTRRWLEAGASGWRMDVSGDPSFPRDYWSDFRAAVESTKPEALTISETWQKDSALLRNVRGDRFDTTMNYRLRDAVLSLLAPQGFDAKGFPESGGRLTASEFAARLLAQREDYADATYYTLMNLLDSHDTERILWTLTPGVETREARELDPENLAEGKARLRLASLIQFVVPGMPTIYYGDEVGLTGDDDPDDRRTYPWADQGGEPDEELLAHYQSLAAMRRELSALVDGDLRVLYADDADGSVALARRNDEQAVVIALNTSDSQQTLAIPIAGLVPDGTTFRYALAVPDRYGQSDEVPASDGALTITLGPLEGLVLVTASGTDLEPPTAPQGLRVSHLGDGYVELVWQSSGSGLHNVYRSPVAGGGWRPLNADPVSGETFRDERLENGRLYHYVVTAVDAAGNESGYSNEAAETPRLSIEEAVLAGPTEITHTISAVTPTEPICGEARIADRTGAAGPAASLRGELGLGPAGTDPEADAGWEWTAADYAGPADDRDRFCATLLLENVGTFTYGFRFSTSNGRQWLLADGTGTLQVTPSDDTSAPAAPTGLRVVSATPEGVELAWQPAGDDDVAGYEVVRIDEFDPKPTFIGRTTASTFTDTDVVEDATYSYRVVAYDSSWNRSASTEVSATAAPRLVTIVFTVEVPVPSGAAVGETVHIAGTLSRLEGDLPQWDPAATPLDRIDDTHWTITLQGREGTELEYKYTLGSWDYVEKDGSCGEIANRTLIVSFTDGDVQQVNDDVPNWRNIDPCGN